MQTHTPTPQSLVFTIGHSNRSIQEFLEILQAHRLTLIIDVRKMPGSRTNPQFNRDALTQALEEIGLGYVHIPKLGGLRRRSPDSPNSGWKNASFQGYGDYMLTPEFEFGLQELLTQVQNQRAALMCAEAVPWRCHRSLIADALLVRGIAVEHILSISRVQPHALRDWALVAGTRITYPPQAEEISRQGQEQPALGRQ